MEVSWYGDEIALWVALGATYESISMNLRRRNPQQSGYSARSVRRYCADDGVHYRSGLTDSQLDRVVSALIQTVGHSYGRRTLHGLLSSQGLHVSQPRISRCMTRVAPAPQRHRAYTARRHLNPPMYNARFFADKLHLDQNEKLSMYSVTHVMAVDGFSRKIVGMVSMPVKNPITIYSTLMEPLLRSTGLWQQVRVDHGTEFVLIHTIQQYLANRRQWQDRPPVLQSTSRQNHRVERMWP